MMSNFIKLWEFLVENEIDPLVAAIVIDIIFGDDTEN